MSVKRSRSSEGRCSITEIKFMFYFLPFGSCANFKTQSFLCGHPLELLFYGLLKPIFPLFLNDTEHLNVNNIVRWCLILVVVDLLRQVCTLTGPYQLPIFRCTNVHLWRYARPQFGRDMFRWCLYGRDVSVHSYWTISLKLYLVRFTDKLLGGSEPPFRSSQTSPLTGLAKQQITQVFSRHWEQMTSWAITRPQQPLFVSIIVSFFSPKETSCFKIQTTNL